MHRYSKADDDEQKVKATLRAVLMHVSGDVSPTLAYKLADGLFIELFGGDALEMWGTILLAKFDEDED